MVVFPYFSTLYKSQSSMNFSKDGIWIEYIEIIYSGLSERQTVVAVVFCFEWNGRYGNDNTEAWSVLL